MLMHAVKIIVEYILKLHYNVVMETTVFFFYVYVFQSK